MYEPKAAEPAVKVPFLVRVSIKDLNIRKGPGTDFEIEKRDFNSRRAKKIAAELNVSFEQSFVLPDGNKISIDD